MMNYIPVILCIVGALLVQVPAWDGDQYYNNLFKDDGINYNSEDSKHCLYSDRYRYGDRDYMYYRDEVVQGCLYDKDTQTVTSCSGSNVVLAHKAFTNITAGTFKSTVTSITIVSCSAFKFFEDTTFENLTSLKYLRVYKTALNHMPDLANTAIENIYLVNNTISMDTNTYRGWAMPNTVERICLADNIIHWLPDKMISGPNLRLVSVSNNRLQQIHPKIFGDVSSLVYFAADGNNISRITKNSLAPLSTNTFLHLNLSNNMLTYIHPESFRQLPAIRILELHGNLLSRITSGTFSDMPYLAYIALFRNSLGTLLSKTFVNLPELKELRLHSQRTPMSSIAYDAWNNINGSLRELFVSDNSLITFPHQVLEEEHYPNLLIIHADHNQIYNITLYGSEAFPSSQSFLHATKAKTKVPFSAYPNLEKLYLNNNNIVFINNTNFCPMKKLQTLYLNDNNINETAIDDDAFACLPVLQFLGLSNNRIQYVPAALKTSAVVPALVTLLLSGNLLTFLEDDAFSGVNTLRTIQLASNNIVAIENGAFPLQISSIDMSNNEFRFLHELPFSNLTMLSTLYLQTNVIQYLPDRVFENATSLRNINLNYNNIPQLLVRHFQNCPLRGTVSFYNNDIGYIEDGTFSHVSYMYSLNLGYNKLSVLPLGGSFTNLTIGDSFTLSNNRFNVLPSYVFDNLKVVSTYSTFSISNSHVTEIMPYAFNNVQVYRLTLSGNPVRIIHPFSFNDVTVSRTLDLSNPRFTHIPERALNNVNAETITMNDGQITTYDAQALYNVTAKDLYLSNNEITKMNQSLFGGVSRVSDTIYLNNNGLTEMMKNSLNNVDIVNIELQSNELTYYPEALKMQNFTEINLTSNKIALMPSTFLSGQTLLKVLRLNNNMLTSFKAGTFKDTISLEYLYVANNMLGTLPDGLFDNLSMLKGLYLYGNRMKHVFSLGNKPSLKTVLLNSNQIETLDQSAFSFLSSLSTLDLATNPLECSCQLVETLDDVAKHISGATCSAPSTVNGIVFTSTSASSPNYYKKVATKLLCSADNLAVSSVLATNFTIEWDQPSVLHFVANSTWQVEPLEGQVDYEIACTSSSSGDIMKTFTDMNATKGSHHLALEFDSEDGVVAGTTYSCTIKVTTENTTDESAKSSPIIFTTLTDIPTTGVAGADDIELQIFHIDFSKDHPDFDRFDYISLSDPIYVPSPYGPWLASSDTFTPDTFSYWFRTLTSNWMESTIILENQADSSKRYWSDAYFPYDARGYDAEGQEDCNGTLHNFGFTSAIKTGLVFSGTETITVGGGEGLWLYVNRVLLVKFIASATSALTCYKIDLSTAASEGGGWIYPEIGTIVNGLCTGLTTSANGTRLELKVGTTYHFDIFLAETMGCTSEFLLQTQHVVFSQNKTVNLPVDYMLTVDEDMESSGFILANISLSDAFSAGDFTVTVYSGNEDERFGVEPSTYTYTDPGIVAPVLTNMTDIDGKKISFLECFPATTNPVPNNLFPMPVTIATSSMYLTLVGELDYEATTSYSMLIEVVDNQGYTGHIGVTITIHDANDNCPTLTPSSVTLTPLPVLVDEAIVTFTVTDADSGRNADVHYVISEVTEDPPFNFDDTMELWNDVYLNYTTLSFLVIAIDNGTIPRAVTASVNITVSNTCVMDVLFGKIKYQFVIDDATGEMFLRIPKYWVKDFACSDDLGLSSGHVLDSMLTASSSFDDTRTGPGRARVNQSENIISELSGGWVAGIVDTNQYVEMDMGSPYKFTKSYIQGRADAAEWVTSYTIQYYNDNTSTWMDYVLTNGTKTLLGNHDRSTVVQHDLDPVILSQKVRVNPQTWNGVNISMRLEFSGCSQAEQLFYDVSCLRCETTFYCEGDGIQKMCGRCENTSATCDRNPIEHSFGAASECTECPKGWICADGYATPCEDLHYVECTNTSCPTICSPCDAGFACYDGIRTMCGPGTYSDGGSEQCVSCDVGFYQNESSRSSCKSCPAGHYSSTRASSCGQCQPDEYSTGNSGCLKCTDSTQCPCLTGSYCYDMSLCYNTGTGTAVCTGCPPGMIGDGTMCQDVDECQLHDPCFKSRCINTVPGYQCLECPDGYTGTYEDAYSWDVYRRVFVYTNSARSNYTLQTCTDVDECQTNHGGCDTLMPCVNTEGSFYCDFCATGYMGTNKTGCYLDNFCVSGAHNCTAGADCVYLGPAQFRCVCKPGYAGDGENCGLDSDNDGFPDIGLPCNDWGCDRDNCRSVPNSMQEDTDGDNIGDNCDRDDDNDGRYDYLDNCQFISNWDQNDSDTDGIGDACDNCPGDSNPDQLDADDDGDGVLDGSDNCPLVTNPGQENADGDSHGDMCDNCPNDDNDNQADTNDNLYGDVCDTKDQDGDGVPDSSDNCPEYMNGDQSDIDRDSIGDLCDDDKDGDGVINDADKCPYLANVDQADVDGNGVGDICESDSDGDGFLDKNDTCPHNPAIQSTSFKDYFTVNLNTSLTSYTAPSWRVKNNGGEVMQTENTAMPTMLIGKQGYGAVEYKGTWYVADAEADDYVGCVFGYVSNRKFYIVMWKGNHGNYQHKAGISGVQIKVVDSVTGPDIQLALALFHSWETSNQVRMLWQDPNMVGWEAQTSYRWYLTHKPTTGYINLKVYQGPTLISDSGSVYDVTTTGGRLGVFQYMAYPVIWSHLVADCLSSDNKGLYLDGVDDYVELDDLETLSMSYSFTIEAWISLDTGYTTGPYPVVCSIDGSVCLLVEGGHVVGRYGNSTVTSSTALSGDKWYNVILRHSIEDQELAIFINAVLDSVLTDVPDVNITSLGLYNNLTVYIGKENNDYFRGVIDEIRTYSVALLNSEINNHVISKERPVEKSYGKLHFRMEDSLEASSLVNSGFLTSPTAILNGGRFVESFQQPILFQIANP